MSHTRETQDCEEVPLSKKCRIFKSLPLPLSTSRQVEDSKLGIRVELMMVLMGYGSGLVVGVVIGHTLTTRKHEWFVNTFGKRQEAEKET